MRPQTRTMVKTLYDCCLQCIASNLKTLNRPGDHLTRSQKEKLLELMYWKAKFTKVNSRIIRDSFLADNLNRNCLPCIDNEVVKLLCPNWLTVIRSGGMEPTEGISVTS